MVGKRGEVIEGGRGWKEGFVRSRDGEGNTE